MAVALAPLAAGETVEVDGLRVGVREPIPVGHKLALMPIAGGAKVQKFGFPIGSTTREVQAGELVHVHNIKSDYIVNDVDHHRGVRPASGYLRADGRKGIRNRLLVAYLVECAHHVARAIATPFEGQGVELIGFSGCYPNGYAQDVMDALCTHPNVGGVLLVSLGCEEFNRARLVKAIADSGRPVEVAVIQKLGGTRDTVAWGRAWVRSDAAGDRRRAARADRARRPRRRHQMRRLGRAQRAHRQPGHRPRLGPAGRAGARVMFEELGELFGCEAHMAARAATPRARRRHRRRRWPRAAAITARWSMAASAAATSPAGSARSKRSRWAPMPRAAPSRSSAC